MSMCRQLLEAFTVVDKRVRREMLFGAVPDSESEPTAPSVGAPLIRVVSKEPAAQSKVMPATARLGSIIGDNPNISANLPTSTPALVATAKAAVPQPNPKRSAPASTPPVAVVGNTGAPAGMHARLQASALSGREAAAAAQSEEGRFPRAWVPADNSGKFLRTWLKFTEPQRVKLQKLVRETVTRTGVEMTEGLTRCFDQIASLQSTATVQAAERRAATPPRAPAPVTPPSRTVVQARMDEPDLSDAPMREVVTRTILEVMDVKLEKRKEGEPARKVSIKVKHDASEPPDWIDAASVLQSHVVDLLRTSLARLK